MTGVAVVTIALVVSDDPSSEPADIGAEAPSSTVEGNPETSTMPEASTSADIAPPVASTSTAEPPPTVSSPPSTPPRTDTTTLSDPTQVVPLGVTLLVAHSQGIDLWSAGGVSPVLTGADVEVAFPDGRGGVVFQRRADGAILHFGDGAPIEWISALGEAPIVVADSATADSLYAVRTSSDHPLVLYGQPVRSPDHCDASSTWPEDFDCGEYSWSDLVILDLADRSERRIERVWGWESALFGFHVGTDQVATTYDPHSDDHKNCYDVFTLDEFITSPYDGRQPCEFEVGDCHIFHEPSGEPCDAVMQPPTITEDDEVVRYLWTQRIEQTSELVSVSAQDGSEISRLPLPGPDSWRIADTHSSGWTVLVRYGCCPDRNALILVSPDGNTSEPINTPFAVIWSTDADE